MFSLIEAGIVTWTELGENFSIQDYMDSIDYLEAKEKWLNP